MKKSTLFKNCLAVAIVNNADEVIRDADIFVENNQISAVGKNLTVQADEIINCENKIALPGFVNTHHHLFQMLTRNLPSAQDAKLFDWLVYHYEIWRNITPEAVHISATCALSELLLTGCTTAADHLYLWVSLAPCSPFSVTSELMRDTAKLAREKKVQIHTHLCETIDEENYCIEIYEKRPLEYMESLDWLGDDVWFAHGIYFNDDEIKKLAR